MSDPRISCLCVTRHRPDLLRRAVRSFQNQSYTERQLLILFESDDPQTRSYVRELNDERIQLLEVPADPKRTLGELRNMSVEHCTGDYICQWDDDDWYRSDRLAVQMESLSQTDKQACVLSRWICLDAEQREAFIGRERAWEGSLLAEKAAMKRYPPLTRGEDSVLIQALQMEDRLLLLDRPDLYVYTFHGHNTWDREHWTRVVRHAVKLDPARTEQILRDIET